jgi:polyphosphate kinase
VRPGVPGLSETIRVISILGRFLEHSRAYCFENGGNREVWIGSADLMHRNLDRRVETLVRLIDPEEVSDIETLFDFAFDPETSAWDLLPDGAWVRRLLAPDGHRLRDYQETLIEIKRKGAFAP